jgi:hypothetical protein
MRIGSATGTRVAAFMRGTIRMTRVGRRLQASTLAILAILCAVRIYGQGVRPADASRPNVIISLGRPTAWTMEQAHYLLERNRAHDLGIAALDLGPLDANEIVGYRLEAVKSLLTAQAQYDATIGKKNSAATSQFGTDVSRYNSLVTKRDRLLDDQASLAAQLAAAQYQLAVVQAQTPIDQTQVRLQQADVARITALKAAADAEITGLNQAIGTKPTVDLTSTVPNADVTTASVIGPNSTFATMLQNVPPGLNNSKLQASIRLDNYINLQYEIVAKQLTLLRDQAGPGRRVVFIELPQSIYVTHKFKPYPDLAAFWGAHLVQTWWRVDELLIAERGESQNDKTAGNRTQMLRPPILHELTPILEEMRKPESKNRRLPSEHALERFASGRHEGSARPTTEHLPEPEAIKKWAESWTFHVVQPLSLVTQPSEPGVSSERQPAYALDLIPRRSALNVVEAQTASHAYGFAGLVGFLTGFGARARYERQRDEYSQFAQQEAYGSAFGKGEDVFGWTFGPLPGTKRLDPGLRTTYAVLVVPAGTRYIRLNGVGCGYRRRVVPKNPFEFANTGEECGDKVTYDVEVPHNDDDFWLTKIFYRPQPSGQRTVVELEGRFGTQVGVLINGTPLQRVVSIGQPTLEQTAFNIPANAGDSGVAGVFEAIAQKQLLLSFVMPKAYVGTPRITIVTPTREAVINGYDVEIKSGEAHAGPMTLDAAVPMFSQRVGITRIGAVYDDNNTVLAQVFGQGFSERREHVASNDGDMPAPRAADVDKRLSLLLNGVPFKRKDGTAASLNAGEYRILSAGVIQMRFDRETHFPHWQVDVIDHGQTETVDAAIKQDDDGPPVLSGKEGERCSLKIVATKKKIVVADVKIMGNFFTPMAAPVAVDKSVTIASRALVSPKLWAVTVTSTDDLTLRRGVLQLKEESDVDSPMIRLASCKPE